MAGERQAVPAHSPSGKEIEDRLGAVSAFFDQDRQKQNNPSKQASFPRYFERLFTLQVLN